MRSPRLNYAFHYGMYRFYRKHYAATRSALVNAAVYAGIAVKLVLSVDSERAQRRDRGPPAKAQTPSAWRPANT